MKRVYWVIGILLVTVAAFAEKPKTQVVVSRPTTVAVPTHVPKTNVTVSKPTTVAPVVKPTTVPTAVHPAKTGGATENAFSGKIGSTTAGGSYSASYKNAKTLAPTDTPKASSLGKGQQGLGNKDTQAASKEALAAQQAPKAESTQPSIDDVLKKTNLPPDLMSKLKQHNFESAGVAKHKNK